MADCMLIPTYWSSQEFPTWKTFDHPTPLDEEGTLGRTLKNLAEVSYPDPVVLFPAPLDPSVEAKIRAIGNLYDLDVRVFTRSDLADIKSILEKNAFPADLIGTIAADSYGGIRNIGLLYAILRGYENAVMIDDDECVAPGYHSQALRYMGETVSGMRILGKTGAVTDENGRKFYDGQAVFKLDNWPKDELFNENVRIEMEAPGSLSPCTVAFGGNMVIHRDMFMRVPFDPFGSRGEDDDYVMNARYLGFPFFFDKDLTLLHLPPKRKRGYWTRQRQDILRFRYAREKIRLFGFAPETVGSFLAYFTQDDLEYKIVSSSLSGARYFSDHREREEFEGFLGNAELAVKDSPALIREKAEDFLRFMTAWGETTQRL
jgi:GT2 family glycosyltransferase